MLCRVTPKEHLGLPDRDAVREKTDSLSTAQIRAAMAKKAEEFKQSGGEIYVTKPAAAL